MQNREVKRKKFEEKNNIQAAKMALLDAEKEFELDEDALNFQSALDENKKRAKKVLLRVEKTTKKQKLREEYLKNQHRLKNLARKEDQLSKSQFLNKEDIPLFEEYKRNRSARLKMPVYIYIFIYLLYF